MLAASGAFGTTMTGKTDEIVSYVQQQTDRLAQMIDGKRGVLVEAIGAKTSQLTLDIDRVTSEALKSIETRSQNFSQSLRATDPTSRGRSLRPAKWPPARSTSR